MLNWLRFIFFLTCIFFCMYATILSADELLMKNGDRLTGEVMGRSSDILKFKTEYAGELAIQWNDIERVQTDQPMILQIANERMIQSQLLTNLKDDGLMIVEEETKQRIIIEQNTLTSINPESWTLGDGYLLTGLVNYSLKMERGNKNKDEMDSDGNVEYRRKSHRIIGHYTFENDRSENVSTKNKWKAGLSYDYFQPAPWRMGYQTPKWYYGVSLFGESNQFADLVLRSGMGPHGGYQFYEGYDTNLKVELALLYIHEEFQNTADNGYLAPGWQVDFDTYLLTDILQFYHKQNGFLGVFESDKLVWTAWTGFRMPLWGGIVASTELELEYDSSPAKGAEELDTTYRLKIGYAW